MLFPIERCQTADLDSRMKRELDLVEAGELAARVAIKEWIRKALRECFLQALRQSWDVRHNDQTAGRIDSGEERLGNGIQVGLSLSGVNSCFAFVERVSRAWQTKLKGAQHERVARWVAQVYQHGKSTLWAEKQSEENNESGSDEYSYVALDNEQHLSKDFDKKSSDKDIDDRSVCSTGEDDSTQNTDKSLDETKCSTTKAIDNDGVHQTEAPSICTEKSGYHEKNPSLYCKLRALGRRREIDSPVLPISNGLQEIKEMTRNHSTHWPLTSDVMDQACSDMSHRMRARDKHGSGGSGNVSNGGKSYTKKAVRFKVLPKSVWETKQQQERNKNHRAESNESVSSGHTHNESNEMQMTPSSVETVLLASMKRKKTDNRSNGILQTYRNRARSSDQHESSRVPFDVSQDSDGELCIDLSHHDKKVLDSLLILDDEDGVENDAQSKLTSISEAPLGLFGGLQHLGEINHVIQNPGSNSGKTFMAKDNDKITRRREKVSIQERLDPNRLQIGRAENPAKRKSKILRTEDWFDDQKKFFDFDMGWCLLEMPAERKQKRLCAFSSMEICLEDSDEIDGTLP